MGRKSNGEGTIIRRQDGLWQGSLQVDGRRKAVYGKTRAECAAKLDELKRQAAAAGTLPQPGKRTVGHLLDAWLETKAPTLKPRTLADYRAICNRYLRPAMGRTLLARLTPDRIARLYATWQRQGKHRTALKAHQVLAPALALAVRWGWLASNPCDRVDAPRYRAKRKTLWTPEQLRRFLDATRDHWLGPLWTFLAYSGCRLGEALALTWQDVDLATGRVVVCKAVQRIEGHWVVSEPKTQAGIRTITLPREGIEALRRQAERRLASGGGLLVFTGQRDGGLLAHTTVQAALRRRPSRHGRPDGNRSPEGKRCRSERHRRRRDRPPAYSLRPHRHRRSAVRIATAPRGPSRSSQQPLHGRFQTRPNGLSSWPQVRARRHLVRAVLNIRRVLDVGTNGRCQVALHLCLYAVFQVARVHRHHGLGVGFDIVCSLADCRACLLPQMSLQLRQPVKHDLGDDQ